MTHDDEREHIARMAAVLDGAAMSRSCLTPRPLDRRSHTMTTNDHATAPRAVDPLREALEHIRKPKYGLQGIVEDYSDTNAYNYHAMRYWRDLAQQYQAAARAALAAAPQPAPMDREALVKVMRGGLDIGPAGDYARADALLAAGLRLPGAVQPASEGRINWRDDPDAIVEDDEMDVRGGEDEA